MTARSSELALHTQGLTKHYGDVVALTDLDLDVACGEVFGFLGPNGAGKTTTIRTILDLIRPTRGSATILGMDSRTDAVKIRTRIGYLPGDLSLYDDLTGRQTLEYFATLRGGVDWDHVDELAQRLDADLSKKVGDYSTGNRQKVGLVQAFMNKPDLIIMDEPSTGLDPLVQQEFQAMMREVAMDGRSVFLSSHTLSEVQRSADRVGIIRKGHLIDVAGVHELRSKAIRTVELVFADPTPADDFASIEGVHDVQAHDHTVRLSFDGEMEQLLSVATGRHHLVDINSEEADLEEIFLAYYRGDEVTDGTDGTDGDVDGGPGNGSGASADTARREVSA